MNEPIKPGDLVQVVKSCCGQALGLIFTVSHFHTDDKNLRCYDCGHREGAFTEVHATAPFGDDFDYAPLHWLKRIPPLSELEGEERREELTA